MNFKKWEWKKTMTGIVQCRKSKSSTFSTCPIIQPHRIYISPSNWYNATNISLLQPRSIVNDSGELAWFRFIFSSNFQRKKKSRAVCHSQRTNLIYACSLIQKCSFHDVQLCSFLLYSSVRIKYENSVEKACWWNCLWSSKEWFVVF